MGLLKGMAFSCTAKKFDVTKANIKMDRRYKNVWSVQSAGKVNRVMLKNLSWKNVFYFGE